MCQKFCATDAIEVPFSRVGSDHCDDFFRLISKVLGELQELLHFCKDLAAFARADDANTTAPREVEQTLVSQHAKCAKDGVLVDTEIRCKVTGRWQSIARVRFARRDRAANLRRDLCMQRCRIASVQVNCQHGAMLR
jgi:hypothetical protein